MFSLFAPRDCRQAVAFLEGLRSSLFPWTLIATGGNGRAPVVTFTPQLHGAAGDWIMKMQRQRRNVLLLMAETHGAVTGVKLMRGHLRGTRHFGVKVTTANVTLTDSRELNSLNIVSDANPRTVALGAGAFTLNLYSGGLLMSGAGSAANLSASITGTGASCLTAGGSYLNFYALHLAVRSPSSASALASSIRPAPTRSPAAPS